MQPNKTRDLLVGGTVVLAMAAGITACSDDDDATDEDTPVTTVDAAADATGDDAEEATGDDDGPTLEVLAVDYAFEGLPDSVEAGTRLLLRNDAPGELHELVAFRLADDEERSVEELVQLPPEELQAVLGEPTTVILAPPESEQVAVPVGDGTLSEPGRYALICMIPTGADPEEYMAAAADSDGPPDVAGGPPHIAHGMYAEIVVE